MVLTSGEESPDSWIGRRLEQHLGVSGGDHGAALGVEEDAIVADLEQAGQFVSDYHNRGSQTRPEFKNQVVEQTRFVILVRRFQHRYTASKTQQVGDDREHAASYYHQHN